MAQKDYYDVLGVPRNASSDDMRSAFRDLARQYHPDVSEASDAEERFKEINEAYAVLSDQEKRAAYDRFGHAGVNGAGIPGVNVDFSDIFEELFNFGRRGRRGGNPNSPRRGSNLQYTLNLEFKEAVFGVEKEIEFTRDEVCSHCDGKRYEPGTDISTCTTCNGRGEVQQARQTLFGSMTQISTCPTCRGTGEIIEVPCKVCLGRGVERNNRNKSVEIPGGVDSGTQIRMNGEGQLGINGGPPGDLFLVVRVKPHKYFKRRDNDIILDLDINIAQATLGADVEIPTVDGPANLRIPSGIQPGKVLRMREKGVPHLRGGGRGDQLVIINIDIPKRLDEEQRQLFEKLADSLGTEVHPKGRGILDTLKDFLGG